MKIGREKIRKLEDRIRRPTSNRSSRRERKQEALSRIIKRNRKRYTNI